MKLDNRIIFKDDATYVDGSGPLNQSGDDGETLSFGYIAADDALYIGGSLPFNHRYFDISTANAVAATVSISLWNGSEFVSVAEVRDETLLAGASLGRSGYILWNPDKDESWIAEDSEDIPELASMTGKIYNLYWAKFTWSDDLTAGTILKSVMHKFSDDSLLGKLYPGLLRSNILTAFKSGKTNWNDQHYLAAEAIIRELKSDARIISGEQIIDPESLSVASAYLVANMAYSAFGDDYRDNAKEAYDKYLEAKKAAVLSIDRNRNARLDLGEMFPTVGVKRR